MRARAISDGGDGAVTRQRDGGDVTADTPDEQRVLVVDDEESLADSIAIWLDRQWTARVAHDGPEALEKYGSDIDAVLLDRRMPAVSGDDVLREIRESDDTPVAMMTAVDPDWSILDLDFEMYLKKPVAHGEVANAVEQLLTCSQLPSELRQLFATASKVRTLRREYPPEAFRRADRYQECRAELRQLRDRADDRIERFDTHAPELRQFVDDFLDEA